MSIERAPEPTPAQDDIEDAFASWRARQQRAEAERISSPRHGTSDESPLAATIREMARERDEANRVKGYIPSRNRVPYGQGRLEFPRRGDRKPGLAVLVGAVGLGAAVFTGPSMTDANYGAEKATEFLEQSGYTDVEHESTDFFLTAKRGCGRDDSVRYEFDATAPNGDDVEILVCKGLWKGATLRQG